MKTNPMECNSVIVMCMQEHEWMTEHWTLFIHFISVYVILTNLFAANRLYLFNL